MKYKKDDMIRVKSMAAIRETLDSNNYCKGTGINFNSKMETICGGTYKVVEIIMGNRILLNTLKVVPSRNWCWSEHWLEPYHDTKLPEDLFEL